MRTAIVQPGKACRQNGRQCRETQDRERQDQDGKHGHLHFPGFDLFAQIFRCTADHQARHKDGDDGEEQHAIETRTDAAKDDFTQLNIDHGDHASQRQQAVVHIVDGTARRIGCDRRE